MLAAAIAIAIATLGAAAGPAEASGPNCGLTLNYDGDRTQGVVDNCPGNGKASWAWLWVVSGAGNGITGWLESANLYVRFGDNSEVHLNVLAGQNHSASFDKKITSMAICEYFVTFNGLQTFQCSNSYGVPH